MRLRVVLLVAGLCLAAGQLRAEDGYWVVIGSFSSPETAEAARQDAADRLGADVKVQSVTSARGVFNRVVVGPYEDKYQAQSLATTARTSGYADAWLVRQGAVPDTYVAPVATAPAAASASQPTDAHVPAVPDGLNLPAYGTDDASPATSNSVMPELEIRDFSRERLEKAVEDELPQEPPPGYNLNRLRRDAQARPPPGLDALPGSTPVDPASAAPLPLPRFSHSDLNIRIDGKLDEAIWQDLPVFDGFRVTEPDTLAIPAYATHLKVFYSGKGLYAGYDLEQPADQLVQRFSARDQGQVQRDHIGLGLDTSGEGLYGYVFSLALGDNQTDGTVLPERRISMDWDAAWYGATARTDTGWSVEMFIPWSQVSMPKQDGQRRMGLYASRFFAARDERVSMPPLPPTYARYLSAMRPVQLEGVNPRQQWSVFPYVAATQNKVEDGLTWKAGADVFWRPTSNFQLTATLNPDFGNVEADDVDVNLTAFETFFPEKRLFFVEGREIFETTPRSDTSRNVEPTSVLNTRRIGGRPRPPREVPPGVTVPARERNQLTELTAAVKATGQAGHLRYGVLAASEDDVKFDAGPLNLRQDGSDYGVVRLLYESTQRGAYAAIGTISTLAAHPEQDALVHGVDVHYLSADNAWKLDGQLLYSDKDDVGKGKGGFFDAVYTVRKGLTFSAGLDYYDDKLDINDLGFLRRNDALNWRLGGSWNSVGMDWARQVNVAPFAQFEVNGDGADTRKGFGTRNTVYLNNLAKLDVYLAYFPSRDEDRESFGNGTFVTEGRQDTSFDYTSDTSRRFSYRVGVDLDGENSGGETYKGRLGVVWRPLDRMTLDVLAEYWRRGDWLLHQGGRNFTTFDTREWRPKLSLEYNLTARQQLRLSAQWIGIRAKESQFYLLRDGVRKLLETDRPATAAGDFAISSLNLQLRYRWEFAPLSDVYVVYTLGGFSRAADVGFDDLLDRPMDEPDVEQLVVKLRYRFGS
ncbi:MAG: SPOR domain-containing protein [Pseudomonadales bacterium]|nr:SPOR domain-containing protein [Pseudomonadales bacterium]MCP5184790.1 SPOR domain-containing protein [Pseudomonadales bacterium]